MKPMTTRELIDTLQRIDPAGNLPVRFRVRDEADGEVVAFGEVERMDLTVEAGVQTDAGDQDVAQLDFELFCPGAY